MSDDDLDLVETDELIDALERRFSGGVLFAGTRELTEDDTATHVYFRGGVVVALGLLRYAEIKVAKDVNEGKGDPT